MQDKFVKGTCPTDVSTNGLQAFGIRDQAARSVQCDIDLQRRRLFFSSFFTFILRMQDKLVKGTCPTDVSTNGLQAFGIRDQAARSVQCDIDLQRRRLFFPSFFTFILRMQDKLVKGTCPTDVSTNGLQAFGIRDQAARSVQCDIDLQRRRLFFFLIFYVYSPHAG